MARRGRRDKGLSDGSSGLLLALLGFVLVAALGGGYWYVKHARPALDQETNCPKAGPVAIHALLFDRSDPISDQQAQRIRQAVDKYKNAAPFGLRFDIYTFQGDTRSVLEPRLRICALGRPSEANQLIENPELVRKRYETKFSAVMDQTVSELLRGSKESISPIIESLRAAAISSFGSVEPGQVPLKLTMISDMVQHTPAYSQFQTDSNFQLVSKLPAWPALQPQLKGADVEILYLLRGSAQRKAVAIQNRGHQAFWEQLVAASGGKVTIIDPM